MAQDTSKILQTRDTRVYYDDYDAANDLPTVAAYGTSWGGSWVDAGLTDGGLSVSIAHDQNPVTADQIFDPAFFIITGRTITLSTNLAQFDPNLIKAASGMGSVDTVAAASGTRGSTTHTIDGSIPTIPTLSVGFEALQVNGEAAQGLVVKGMPTGTITMTVGDPGQKSLVPLEVTALAQSTSSDPVFLDRIITPALP